MLVVTSALSQSAWAQEAAPDETTLPATTHPSSLDFSGALRFDYFSSSRTLDDRKDFPGGTLQAKIQPEWNGSLRGKLEGRINQPKLGTGTADSTLLESYLALRTETTEWRLGKQLVAWGRADGINPTDNLTPRDFTVLLPFAGWVWMTNLLTNQFDIVDRYIVAPIIVG